MNDEFDMTALKNILIKKAKGFFYTEEQVEYENRDKTKSNCGENDDVGKVSRVDKKISKTRGGGVNVDDSIIESPDVKDENIEKLVVVKKKISTHYIPPDSLSIKMLYEIFGTEIGVSDELSKLEQMTDEELNNEIKKIEEDIENCD